MSIAEETEIFEVVLPERVPTPLERDKLAFLRLLPELLQTHRDLYVAVHDDRVVDWGSDQFEVAVRAQTKVGGGVYVGLVSVMPQPVLRSGVIREVVLRRSDS